MLDDGTVVILGIGEDVDDADFGYQPLGVIGDTVFADEDGDGVQDAGEPGLAGITVDLLDGSGTTVDSTTTDAGGRYAFPDRPAGSYVVRVDVSTLPSDTTTQTADPDSIVDAQTEVLLAPAGTVTDADFGFQPLGSIGDTVFADFDGDGLQAGPDVGLPGVGVDLLDGVGAVIDATTTAVDGSYRFDALPRGTYTVRIDVATLPARTTSPTADRDGSPDHRTTILLGPGQDVDDADFGYQPLGSIGDLVFADHDGNGSRGAGEPALVGVTIELLDAGGVVIDTALTDAAGRYRFDDLATGDYTVRVDPSTLPVRTTNPTMDRDTTADGSTVVALAPGEVVDDADFGFQPLGTIGDSVYRDDDGDGTRDPGEPGLAGVVVELLDASGSVIGSDTTDTSGDYRFDDLPTEDYTVRVSAASLPAGVTTPTADRDAVPDGTTAVSLAPAEVVDDADFGFQPLGFIGDRVFADLDGDGSQDPGEPGLSGVTIELLDAWGAVGATTVTGPSGAYGFAGLAIGTYTVRVDVSTLPPSTTSQTADPDAVIDARHQVILPPGASVTSVDFGFQPLGSIGDTVFADHDGDGTQDPGEPGIPGVGLELFSSTGTLLSSTVTDGSGGYRFDALPTGDYEVRLDPASLPTATTTPTLDRDGVLDGSTILNLAPGATVDDADFGYQPLGSIGDTVFADLDGNGVQAAGEPGLDGVTVDLLDGSGVVLATAVTAAGGGYRFDALPTATYTVRIDEATLPATTRSRTADPDGTADGRTTIALAPGGIVTNADFGYRPLGSVGDRVFADLDGNGAPDAGEPGLPGVTVELRDGSGILVADTVTDATGTYRFPDLAAGAYEVRIDASTLPAGTTSPTADRDGVLDGATSLTLASGAVVDDVDFGYQPLGSIGDLVFADLDGNGSPSPGEAGLSGVDVELLDAGGALLATSTTDGAGAYSFPGLPGGDYTVRIVTASLPATTTTPTGDRDGVLDAQTSVTLAPGESADDVDFGFQPLGSIGDTVFADDDGDGLQDPGEPGLPGVTVDLLDTAGAVLSTAVTNGFGHYSFGSLPAGSFTVRIDTSTLPTETTTATADPDLVLDDRTTVALPAGGSVATADFGYQPLGSIGDTVFADDDGDGTQGGTEPGLSGVTVELLDGAGALIASTSTDSSGSYSFTGLTTGTHGIRIVIGSLPSDTTTPTTERDPVLDGVTSVLLGPGESVSDADFGFQPVGAIGDTVFADHDGDGVQDPGEPGLAGVSVELEDAAGSVIATTVTGPSGAYSFTALPAGTYTVRVDTATLPADTVTPTADRDGLFDATTTVTLAAGSSLLDVDFGFRPLGSIGDTVFADGDGDGAQDIGEPGLAGVALDLLDGAGTVLDSTTTDSGGGYRFDGLPAGDYRVRVDASTLPTNTRTQTADPDGVPDDATDVTLAAGAAVVTADFGYRPLGSIGDTVFADHDGDGILDGTEPGLGGVTVELRNAGGGLIDSTVTDASGRYGFDGLIARDYVVRVDPSTLPTNTTTPTVDRDAVADGRTSLSLAAGETVTDVDFGFRPLGSIGDLVFADLDGDGVLDPGEPGIAGVTVDRVDAAGTTVGSTVTDGSGVYGFDALPAGDHVIRVVAASLPPGYDHPTVDRDAVADRETLVSLAPGQSIGDADFGFRPLGSIGDTVFADRDGNGVQDPGEPGLGGVDVELSDGAGAILAVTTTDGSGRYGFADLGAGDYTIRVVASTLPPRTVAATVDRDAIADGTTTVGLGPAEIVDDADFGFRPLGSIGDTVFADVDGDGARDVGEPGLAGVTVELVDDLGAVVASTSTDSSGRYALDDVPAGTYTVRVVASTLPAGTTTPTADRDGVADGETIVVLGPAEVVDDADYGFVPLGAIGDLVFADADGDGILDAGESGLAGVTLRLLDGAGVELAVQTTDGSGGYRFDGLAAGDYVVRVDESTLPPSTTTRTADRDGTLDGETAVTLAPASVVATADFGYQPLGSIGDTVFADHDGDGVQDLGEPGLATVVVELVDGGGSVVATAITDALGGYRFDGLIAGDHSVRVEASTLPANTTTPTGDRDGTADGVTLVPLAPGQDVDDADFGFQPRGSIGDTVYADDDGDGSRNGGELGLAAVTLELLDGSGALAASTVSDATGAYSFADLPAGSYTVRVVTSTLPASTTTATGDRDGVLDGSTSVTLSPGEDLSDADFGFQPTGTIGTTIFADLDGNGIQDPGDDGLAGVGVDLLDPAGSVLATTVTNGFGHYSFGSLPAGTYTVRVDPATLPATTTTGTADRDGVLDGRTTVTLTPGQAVGDADFGYRPLGSIGDTVFRDDDGNGTQGPSEPGLSGVTVRLLDAAGAVLASVATDASGGYSFTDLAAGSYTVAVDSTTLPPGTTVATADPDAVLDGRTTLNLASGELEVDADFGFQPRGVIGDLVFADLDGDGSLDAGEPGLAGVTVELLDAAGAVVASTTTDGAGGYRFDELPIGDHTIRVDVVTLPPGASTPTSDRDGVADSTTVVALGPAEVIDDADFGFVPLGSIGDLVFGDDDGSGTFDATETGLPGVTVELLDGAGVVLATAVTDAAGAYRFDGLRTADYTVRIDVATLPLGSSLPTADRDGVADGTTTLTLAPATVVDDADFGFRTRGAIGDRVFRDDDGNGIADAGEPGIPAVVIELLDPTGVVVASTTTDADGTYRFESLLPGVHIVRVDVGSLPGGTSTQTADRDAVLDSSTTVTLATAEVVTDADFGYRAFGSIGATVWSDPDGDGSRGPGEPAIPDVTVELLDDAGAVLATTTTDPDGSYLFDSLPAATYVVRVVISSLPGNTTTPTADLDGVLDGSTTIVLGAGEALRTPSFGFRPLAVIGDTVWFDRNGDGVEDAGELGVSGVTLELLDAGGLVVATTVTDGSGRYRFGGLAAGDHTVRVDVATLPPTALSPTSDADGVADHQTTITVTAGEIVDRVDFGYLPAPDTGDVSVLVYGDLDGDGAQNNGESGVADVAVRLVDGAGGIVAQSVTGSDGTVTFTGLVPGSYTVRVDPDTLPIGTRTQTEDPDSVLDHATPTIVVAGAVDGPSVFGYAPDPAPVGSITGTIFDDLDRNSARSVDEPPRSGIVVILFDVAGVELRRTVTDADGRYSFDALPMGSYEVEVVPPADRELSPASNVDGESEFGTDRRTRVELTAGGQVEIAWGGLTALQPNSGTTTVPPTTAPPTTAPPTTAPPTTAPPTLTSDDLQTSAPPTTAPPTTRDSGGISPQVGDSAQVERSTSDVGSRPPGSLAFTGTDAGFLAALGGWLLAIGAGLVVLARRRRPEHA